VLQRQETLCILINSRQCQRTKAWLKYRRDLAITSVIGSSDKGAVDFRRWPAWDLRSHSLGDFFGVEMIFSALKRKAFISAIDV